MPKPAKCARRFLLSALFVLFRVQAQANDLYVATNGTPSGPGTMAQPYDLATAISSRGQPGDTFWLRGGTYTIGHINTTNQGAPGQSITYCELPGEHARVNGSLEFYGSSGNMILRDFELFSSDTNRVSSQTGVGFNPTDITPLTGISSFVPSMSFINLIIHDATREGIYVSQQGSNDLIYGCVIYNNGWRSPDNAEGHGIYVQGEDGDREIDDDLVFNNAGVDLHIYENDTNYLYLAGITLNGNVAFNGGALQNVRLYRDIIVGVDPPALSADRIVFKNNLGYLPANPTNGVDDACQIGREGINGGVAILNNYLPAGLEVNNWTIAAVSGNSISCETTNFVVSLDEAQATLSAAWNNNIYVVPATSQGFLSDTDMLTFAQWQSVTGYDLNSTYTTETPGPNRTFIETNAYEPGRANIIVYNWTNQTNVAVDVSSALAYGTSFEVRNAEDYFAPPVVSGVFTNQVLNLPMTGLTVAVPNGPMLTPAPTGPTFNVFVLLPRLVRLQAMLVGKNLVQISWPTNAGNWILQSSLLQPTVAWADVTNTPSLANGQNVVTNTATGSVARIYRLRPAF